MRGSEPDVIVQTTSSVQTADCQWPVFNWRPRGISDTVGSLRQVIDPEKKKNLQKAMDIFSGHRDERLYFDSLKSLTKVYGQFTTDSNNQTDHSLTLLVMEDFPSW